MKGLFKLSTLAVSVLAASQVSAIELYNAEGTTANMYGAIAAHVSKYDYDKSSIIGNDYGLAYNSDKTLIEDPGSWFGFDLKHQFGSVYGIAKIEWDVDFSTATDLDNRRALTARQTYAGFGHDDFGSVTIGRQESPYMKTDKGYYAYWVGGLNMMQSDELGSRRAPNTVVWQNDFDNLYVGLQYQAARNVDDYIFFGGNGLNFGGLLFVDPANPVSIDDGFGGSLAYTIESTGTYLAAAYNQANNINGSFLDLLGDLIENTATDAEIKQYAIAVEQHLLEGGLSLSARFEQFFAKDGANAFDTETTTFGMGANFYVSETVRIYGGYEMAEEKNNVSGATKSEVSQFNLGAAWAPVPWGEVYLEGYNDDVKLNESYTFDNEGNVTDFGGNSKGTHVFLGAAVFF
ncbi:porin [Vibrio hangzhouensis]|uniref:Outer membrane protein (Porin) n=1 Tax=Vibrio hangzhouensis TaxID=462991 RepID=A0A1H5S7T8_9VIBR|nr:porin [Vibrio hangzhouensis]SEF45861.1 Outer membrane protein (porin) [Vibrio hangzhouensis]